MRPGKSLVAALAALTAISTLLAACGHSGDGGATTSTPSATTVSADTPVPPTPLAPVPAALPRRLGIGLMNNPQQLDWMTSSGIPWDYRYQYLTGGVNTGDGWSTWGWPQGNFVDDYLSESARSGHMPVLTYYQIVPSAPDPSSEDVLPKLANASTMKAYYDDWALLMQKVGAFGKTVIVHVEPDLWGYMQQADEDATKVKVMVSSSGNERVSAFDDNAAGFAQALVHLRDVYAPNALLAFHVSSWAVGKDLILNHADPAVTASAIDHFYDSLGASFDLLFVDASDRDAAWYKHMTGKDDHWWKDADFDRFTSFVGDISRDFGKRVMLWQVPIGNTIYRSVDNEWGHYQDNRAQYWLGDRSHLQALADNGVIAILFGAGANGCTLYTDDQQDGVTNPDPVDGNDQQALYSDDDGGFLRLNSAAYYRSGPIPLNSP